jgi:outer membrane protein insertion porin family
MRFIIPSLLLIFASVTGANAQIKDTILPTSFDPELAAIMQGNPQEYTVDKITTRGAVSFNPELLISISGLAEGDKVILPGGDLFSRAIMKLWEQKYFADVAIYLTGKKDKNLSIEIYVKEMPKVSDFIFKGTKNKTERIDLEEQLALNKNKILTENLKRAAKERILKFYSDKSYVAATVDVEEKIDPTNPNSRVVTFRINRGDKKKIDNINFAGNTSVSDSKLKKQMKGNKERVKATLFRTDKNSAYENVKPYTAKQYFKKFGFLSLNKTREFLAPWLRVKLASGKFSKKKLDDDRNAILDYYNTIGYRDAAIEKDTFYYGKGNNMNLEFKIDEGRKYYFGDITFKGNSKFSDSILINFKYKQRRGL